MFASASVCLPSSLFLHSLSPPCTKTQTFASTRPANSNPSSHVYYPVCSVAFLAVSPHTATIGKVQESNIRCYVFPPPANPLNVASSLFLLHVLGAVLCDGSSRCRCREIAAAPKSAQLDLSVGQQNLQASSISAPGDIFLRRCCD